MSKVEERFWSKVSKKGIWRPGMPSCCWEWTGACDPKGYPRFKLNGISMYANRARLDMEGVTLTSSQHVVTFCRNRRCVRPDHHALGTAADARALGGGGFIGPGDQLLARKLIANAETDLPTLAMAFGISIDVAQGMIAVRSDTRQSEGVGCS